MSDETMNAASGSRHDTDVMGGIGANGRELNRVQIFKHGTKDRLLDVGDMLSLDPRRNKIVFSLIAFDDDYHVATRVRHYVDVADAKLLCFDMLHGFFTEWTDYKGSKSGDAFQARIMSVRKDAKYRQPFVIKIDNGVGEPLPGGAVKMAEVSDSLTLLLSEWDARKMALALLDYVRDWETINFRKRQEAQTQLVTLPGIEAGDSAVATPALSKNRYARATSN